MEDDLLGRDRRELFVAWWRTTKYARDEAQDGAGVNTGSSSY